MKITLAFGLAAVACAAAAGDIRERARVKVVPGGFLACAPGFVLTIR